MSRLLATLLLLLCPIFVFAAAPTVRVPLLVDTDIGDAFDDALALGWLLANPSADIRAITSVHGDAHTRALIVCRMLHACGRGDIPVAGGAPAREGPAHQGQMQYGLRPARKRPGRESAVTLMYQKLRSRKGELTVVCLGPLTNLANLFDRHPDCKPWVRRLIVMGGALRAGYDGKPPTKPEWNFACDPAAARHVLASGVPITLVPLDATWDLRLPAVSLRKVLDRCTPLSDQLAALHNLAEEDECILFDPLAALVSIDRVGCKLTPARVDVDDKGNTRLDRGKPNVEMVTVVDRAAVLRRFLAPLTAGPTGNPLRLPATNQARPVPRGTMPARVHVVEDYSTDIEQRWWLAGRIARQPPPGLKGGRVCRGVLSDDFDGSAGLRGLYRAVIFNPVPGPPMGSRSRLSFHCWLSGSDRLRVQLYSLTRNYHRHLTLTRLAQHKWLDLTVDMTQARRPDGSGGPLSADERIDDIQLYTDRDTELYARDIVLYEAADTGEKRAFPSRIFFTGWFDTGRQGKEWPGSFDIVPHQPPLRWKFARSVIDPATKTPWVRVGLRGRRPVSDRVEVRFRYRVTGGDSLSVEGAEGKVVVRGPLLKAVRDRWTEATVALTGMKALQEVRFRGPAGAMVDVDDVLVYEPGR
jgi:inosine-uridine nucleoside N-ribohydrolase